MRVLRLPFGSPQPILFFFIEYKLSFRHGLYYASSFLFVHQALGINREQFQAIMERMSHTRRSTTLGEVANAAVFAASDLGSGMLTGAVVNLTGGKIGD